MSVEAPPAYSDVTKALDKAIADAKPLPNAALQKLADDIAERFDKPISDERQKELMAEIATLSTSTLTIEQVFYKISGQFDNLLSFGKITDELKADIATEKQSWDDIFADYIKVLLSSRELAGQASASIKDFRETFLVFLMDETVSMNTKIDEIKKYQEELKTHRADEMVQQFKKLIAKVDNASSRWEEIAQLHDLAKLTKEISELRAQISEFQVKISELDNKIIKLSNALEITAVGAGVCTALAIVCPIVWVGVLLTGVGTAVEKGLLEDAKAARNNTQAEVDRCNEELEKKVAQAEAIAKLMNMKKDNQDDLNKLVKALTVFAHVWATIALDLTQVIELMDKIKHDQAPGLLYPRLKNVANMYGLLDKALDFYAQNVEVKK